MTKIVIVNPGEIARAVDHAEADVELDTLYKYVGGGEDVTVDVVRLGRIPSGVMVDAWVDDEGLLKDSVKPNRRLPNGSEISGPIVVCATDDGGNSRPLSEDDADWLVRDINARWGMLREEDGKPEPGFRITEWT